MGGKQVSSQPSFRSNGMLVFKDQSFKSDYLVFPYDSGNSFSFINLVFQTLWEILQASIIIIIIIICRQLNWLFKIFSVLFLKIQFNFLPSNLFICIYFSCFPLALTLYQIVQSALLFVRGRRRQRGRRRGGKGKSTWKRTAGSLQGLRRPPASNRQKAKP